MVIIIWFWVLWYNDSFNISHSKVCLVMNTIITEYYGSSLIHVILCQNFLFSWIYTFAVTICFVSYVCVCVCLQFGIFSLRIVAQQQMVSPCASCPLIFHFLPACRAACRWAFKNIFHNILLSHPWREIVKVRSLLETGHHQHSLIFTTVCQRAKSVTTQGTTAAFFCSVLFCFHAFNRNLFFSLLLPVYRFQLWGWQLKDAQCSIFRQTALNTWGEMKIIKVNWESYLLSDPPLIYQPVPLSAIFHKWYFHKIHFDILTISGTCWKLKTSVCSFGRFLAGVCLHV